MDGVCNGGLFSVFRVIALNSSFQYTHYCFHPISIDPCSFVLIPIDVLCVRLIMNMPNDSIVINLTNMHSRFMTLVQNCYLPNV